MVHLSAESKPTLLMAIQDVPRQMRLTVCASGSLMRGNGEQSLSRAMALLSLTSTSS